MKSHADVYLASLYDVIELHAQAKEPDEDKVWSRVTDKLSAALGAEAATYYVYLASKRQLLPTYAMGPRAADLKGTPVDIRTGLCGWVASYREPLLVDDAYQDERFLQEVDKVTGFHTKTVLAIPLFDRLELTGVIQLINKRSGVFTRDDLRFVSSVSTLTAVALRALALETTVDKVTARNASILENLGGGFMAIDAHGRVMLCNPAAKRILSLAVEVPHNIPVDQALAHIPRLSDILLDTLSTHKIAKRQELTWTHQGETKIIGYGTLLIQDTQGSVTGAGITFQDITHVKK
ncbi:MAG: GAF domain-containing protein [Elusimicrobia bacterium]|nr:GAF domain-containing protein [Elusimicrobiota bacterium]